MFCQSLVCHLKNYNYYLTTAEGGCITLFFFCMNLHYKPQLNTHTDTARRLPTPNTISSPLALIITAAAFSCFNDKTVKQVQSVPSSFKVKLRSVRLNTFYKMSLYWLHLFYNILFIPLKFSDYNYLLLQNSDCTKNCAEHLLLFIFLLF